MNTFMRIFLLRRGWGRFFGAEQPPSIPPEYRGEEKQQYLSGYGTRAPQMRRVFAGLSVASERQAPSRGACWWRIELSIASVLRRTHDCPVARAPGSDGSPQAR